MTDDIEKLKMHSPDLTAQNVDRIAALFPGCVTEAKGPDGTPRRMIDFDLLRQELSDSIVDGPQERYHLDWPGKRQALITANVPIAKTLRPARGESVDFDTTRNLFIEGDNLEALKLLQETYLGRVKMIYIDPPYNTGNDFVYDDDFAESAAEFLAKSNQVDAAGNRLVANTQSNGRFHSDWLSMMYSRLKVARDILSPSGCIAISIDEHEVSNLWRVCDEIFGPENFVECIVYDKKSSAKGVPPVKMISSVHEYILVYQRANDFAFIGIPRSRDGFANPDNDPRGPWRNTNCKSTTKDVLNSFAVTDPVTGRSFSGAWAFSVDEMNRKATAGELIFPKSDDGQVRMKEYFFEFKNENTPIKSSWGLYDSQYNTQMLESLMGGKFFQNPKHIKLITDLISYVASDGDIILDFFAGSATTAHACMLLNAKDGGKRTFATVQIDEVIEGDSSAAKAGFATIAEISKERIRRAGAKILEGECHPDWNRDVGFRVLKIDSSNMADVYYTPDATTQADLLLRVDNIKQGRTAEDLLFQVLLDWGVDLTLPITRETVEGKTVFTVAGTALIACFDNGVDEALVKTLATRKPLRVVFKDTGFKDDATKINVKQIFKSLSPDTDVKAI
jgi:adenine-specific DNA-methyltransferase